MIKYLLTLLLFSSCVGVRSNHEKSFEIKSFKGIVHLNYNGCPYYIEVTNCLVSNLSYYLGKKIYPIELDEKFKKEGVAVEFDLTVSKAPSPEDCLIDYVVSIQNISLSKK